MITGVLAVMGGWAIAAQDKYTVKVPNGLSFSEFRGYESGGWGYAVFEYDAASDSFTPGTLAGKPPQGNDAKCGFACHTMVKTRDYVFTDYGHR
jgi:hypothetical protein